MRQTRSCRTLLLLTCLCVLAQAAYPQPGDQTRRRPPSRLYPVTQSDGAAHKKGYIDPTGKFVIGFDRLPERTSSAGEFQEGRAVITVTKETPYIPGHTDYLAGYIDETGAVVIKPRFILARDFSEGLAYVFSEDFEGFIDRQGKVVITLKDEGVAGASDFREGLAAVAMKGGLWGYINRAGEWAIKPQRYDHAHDFSEGLAAVVTHRKYGFINRKGEMIIPARFDLGVFNITYKPTLVAGRFSEGLARVKVGRLYGFIDKSGEFVIPPRFSQAQEFSEGLAWVVTEDADRAVANKAGWIDKTGRWVIEGVNGRLFTPGMPEFFTTYADWSKDWRYSEGLMPFTVYSGEKALRGYMNRKGEVVIQPRAFTKAGAFAGGFARVSFFDLDEARTDEGKRPADQTAALYHREKYGYIDRTGRLVWYSK